MNRQKREEAIRAGLIPDKKKHEQHPARPEERDQVRGGPTGDPNRPPRPEQEPGNEQPSDSRR